MPSKDSHESHDSPVSVRTSAKNEMDLNLEMFLPPTQKTGLRGSAGAVVEDSKREDDRQRASEMKPRKRRKGQTRGKAKARLSLHGSAGSGKLSTAYVQKIVDRATRKIQRCYERGMMKSNTHLSGKITLRWTIQLNGGVREVTQVSNSVSPVVGKCVMKVVRGLKFPRPKGGMVVVTYPWTFSPQ